MGIAGKRKAYGSAIDAGCRRDCITCFNLVNKIDTPVSQIAKQPDGMHRGILRHPAGPNLT